MRQVLLIDDHGGEVVPVNRFLSQLVDAGHSPSTGCAYGYDLQHLAQFLTALEALILGQVGERADRERLTHSMWTRQDHVSGRGTGLRRMTGITAVRRLAVRRSFWWPRLLTKARSVDKRAPAQPLPRA